MKYLEGRAKTVITRTKVVRGKGRSVFNLLWIIINLTALHKLVKLLFCLFWAKKMTNKFVK